MVSIQIACNYNGCADYQQDNEKKIGLPLLGISLDGSLSNG